jgi:hypothetical protein
MMQAGLQPVALSVVTACFNSAAALPALARSLREQTDPDFEWVVADGASTDGSVEYLRSLTELRLVLSSQPDFGIYDALNRGVRLATGEYYIVAGVDDQLHPGAIAGFREAIARQRADFVAAEALFGRHCFRVKRAPEWLVAEKCLIAHHSVATAIRKSLHEKHGFYSQRFPIAADSLFVMQACKAGASRHVVPFIAGTLGVSGVTASDRIGSATELFRVQLLNGRALLPQLLLLLLRILKGSSSGVRSAHDALFRHAAPASSRRGHD